MAKVKDHIRLHYLTDGFSLRDRTRLKTFVLKLLAKEGRQVDAINYIFCSDEYLLEINRQYLKHNTYTDIITFELSQPGEPVLSDIYISIDRVRENAFKFETSFNRELHRVLFHGALHLSGFTDKSPAQSKQMRAKEDFYLSKYFVSRGTSQP